MYRRSSKLSALLPRIRRFLFQFSDLCDRNSRNGLSWTTALVKEGLSQQIRDYWIDLEGDINVLEARALCNALGSFFPSIRNARIDAWTDKWLSEQPGRMAVVVFSGESGVEKDRRDVSSWKLRSAFEIYPIGRKDCWRALPYSVWHWFWHCPRRRGPEFKRGLDHTRLTWCLWTATVAEEGMEACCLVARLSRLLIL